MISIKLPLSIEYNNLIVAVQHIFYDGSQIENQKLMIYVIDNN